MNLISWNIGLTNEWIRFYFMGLNNPITYSIYKISKQLLDYDKKEDIDFILLQEFYSNHGLFNKNIIHKFPNYIIDKDTGLSIYSKYKLQPVEIQKFNKHLLSKICRVFSGFLICYIPYLNTYVCNIHFSCNMNNYTEFKTLKRALDNINLQPSQQLVFGGDFNIIRTKFNAFCNIMNMTDEKENLNNLSYHHIWPCNLDYIGIKLTHNSYKELKTEVIKTYESDHFPIIVRV